MKKLLFRVLASINKVLLPRYGNRDLTKLSKLDKAIIAYRFWVTTRALDS